MDIMETEFSCETYGEDDLEVFDGKIVSINSNFINVKAKTGDEYTVHLGGCTRIETVSQEKELPEVGDNIFFKGRFKKHGSRREYNGYHLTCYWSNQNLYLKINLRAISMNMNIYLIILILVDH